MLDQLISSWQMSLRAMLVFLFGLVMIRLFGRKAFGKQSPLDIVISIVIGSNLSRALTGNARFVPTLVATGALVLAYWLLAHATARWPALGRLMKGAPVELTRASELDSTAMKRAAVGDGDIEEAARRSGLWDPKQIERAVLERSGKISVRGRS